MILSKRNSKFISTVVSLVHPWLKYYYRVRVRGIERVGPGPYLFISNHNAGAAIEVLALLSAWETRFKGQRPIYALAHRADFKMKWSSDLFLKIGAIPATPKDAQEVLTRGFDLAIFPGGNREGFRPIWERHRCDFGGHQGWAKIAIQADLKLIPIAISGSHETNPMFFRSRLLSRLLIVPRFLEIDYFPISFAQITLTILVEWLFWEHCSGPVLVLVGYLTFLVTLLCPILPSQITIDFLKEIPPESFQSPEELYQIVTLAIDAQLKHPQAN
jgi:1-acyl-sn-glycerol-3-phosphate acyltransferase